jgi:hypothetical protein
MPCAGISPIAAAIPSGVVPRLERDQKKKGRSL